MCYQPDCRLDCDTGTSRPVCAGPFCAPVSPCIGVHRIQDFLSACPKRRWAVHGTRTHIPKWTHIKKVFFYLRKSFRVDRSFVCSRCTIVVALLMRLMSRTRKCDLYRVTRVTGIVVRITININIIIILVVSVIIRMTCPPASSVSCVSPFQLAEKSLCKMVKRENNKFTSPDATASPGMKSSG